MIRPSLIWIGLAAVYSGFFLWYTSFGGPLRPEEIRAYLSIMEQDGRSPDEIAGLRRFLEEDTGDDFVMLNAIELREPPTQVEGVRPGETANEVLGKYMEYMWPALLARACHPVFMGTVAAQALDVWGVEGANTWSQAALMRYRSRRDMMDVATNSEFQGRHAFKLAAMQKTITFPVDPWFQLGDPRLVLGLLLLVLGFAYQALAARAAPGVSRRNAGPG